jgi:Calcineurin-like phosphoesterase
MSHQASAVEKSLAPTRLAELAKSPSTHFPPLSNFGLDAITGFLSNYAKHCLSPRPPFPKPGSQSVLKINDQVTFALAGDWATGTDESAIVGGLISAFHPDYTIHLGDIYYVGESDYIEENCCNKRQANGFDPVYWPHGSIGTFAMNGNHEAYARNNDFFNWLKSDLKQAATCFFLYNAQWCILGLDTGYNSEGIPFLGWLGEKYNIPLIKPRCDLPDEVIDWLKQTVIPLISANQSVIVLTHHQYISSFDNEYDNAAEQLSEFPALSTREVLWFWGHEHRLAGYDLCGDAGIKAYGRCIGHGGMPVELGSPDSSRPLRFCDQRYYDPDTQTIVPGPTEYGVNGYARLTFNGPNLTVEYRDIEDTLMVTEQWQAQGSNPKLVSQTIDPSLKP